MALGNNYFFEDYRSVGRYGKRNGKRGSMRYLKRMSARIERRRREKAIAEQIEG